MPNNMLKAHYKHKQGCGCKMCKPWKGHGADRRRPSDKKADQSYLEQVEERSVAQPGSAIPS